MAAPAESAAPAADTGTSAVDTSAPDSGTSVGSEGSSAPADVTQPSLPGADEFGWDTWDGTHDLLPEPLRPWAQRFEGHYTKEAKAAREEAERNAKLYEALMEGREDPRVGEYRTKYETEAQTHARIKAEHEQIQKQHTDYQKQVSDYFEKQAEEKLSAWAEKHQWLFDGGEIQKEARTLLEVDGFEYEDLPLLMRMPDAMRASVRKHAKDLSGAKNAGKMAIKLARAEFTLDESSPAAQVVAGSYDAIPSARIADRPGPSASVTELAQHHIRQALRG